MKPQVLILPQVGRQDLIFPPRAQRVLTRVARMRRCPEGPLTEEQFAAFSKLVQERVRELFAK